MTFLIIFFNINNNVVNIFIVKLLKHSFYLYFFKVSTLFVLVIFHIARFTCFSFFVLSLKPALRDVHIDVHFVSTKIFS